MAKNKKQTEQKQVKQQKQPTIKEQVYSSIANAHVQQAMKNAGIPTAQERMESDYNNWQAMQKYEADYNAWAKAQQPKKQTSSIPTVEPIKFLTAQERKALKEEQQIGKDAPYDPEKTYAKLYGNDKKHYSHQSYFRGDPETEQREKERHNQLVKEQERKQIASNVAQLPKKSYMDMYTEQTLKRSDQDKAVREVNRKKTADKLTSSMLDVTGANQKKDTGLIIPFYQAKQISKTEKDNRTVDEKISTWLDPSYKMSKSEEKEAKAIAEEGLKQFSGKKYKNMSAEEKALYDQYLLLDKKTSNAAAFFENAKNAVRKAGNSLSDLWLTINQANAPTSEALNTQREVIAKNRERIQKQNEEISPLMQSLQTQNPVASGAGTFAGNVGMYYLTGPIIDGLGAAASISSPVGKFIFNQIAQLGQDVLLDYKPTIDEFLADGNISDDEWKQLAINLGIGEAANIVPGIPNLVGDLKTAKNAANSFSEIDALVNNATRQANDAVANIENLSKQIPALEEYPVDSINNQFRDIMRQYNAEAPSMRDVYTADDLSRSMDNQFSELMKQRPQEPVNTIPSLEELQELEREARAMDDIDDYSNIWANPANNTPTANAPTRIDLPEDVQELLVSDFQDMYRMLDDMQEAAEATGNAKVMEKFERLQNSMFDFENKAWKAENLEEVNKAKKTADASRQAFVREMKKVDPNYRAELTGTRIGQAEYRRTSMKLKQEEAEDLAKSFMDSENELSGAAKTQNPSTKELKAVVEKGLRERGYDEDQIKEILRNPTKKELEDAANVLEQQRQLKMAEQRSMLDLNEQSRQMVLNENPEQYRIADPDSDLRRLSSERALREEKLESLKTADEKEDEALDSLTNYVNRQRDAAQNRDMNLQHFAGDNGAPEPNWKVSETYTNTGARGGGWNAEEMSKHTKEHNYLYETIDEQRSVEEAARMRAEEGREAFKNRVLYADRLSSIEIDGLMMEWRELVEEARAAEAAGKRTDNLWIEANKIFRKVQEQSTDNAQALQALAKWSRNTPEGMLVNAENIINGKTKVKGSSELQKKLDQFAKRNKRSFEFSPEFTKQFLDEAEKLQKLDLNSREAREGMAKLGKMVNEQIPVKFNEKLQTYLMDNMLGNFRTLISRNAGGNVGLNFVEQTLQRPLAAGIDSLVAKKTGKRTQAGLTVQGLTEYLQGFRKGLADELADAKTGLHTARTGENSLEQAIGANRRIFKNRLLNLKDQLVRHGLSIGDRPFYESVYKQTMGDYQRLYDKGVMGDIVQNLSPEEFKEYSEVAAHLNALGAVYQQNSTLSDALLQFKRAVGKLSEGTIGVDILSQFSMPFVKTPANVIERAIDYSPLGAVRNAFRTGKELKAGAFDQNRFANETARNILGTGLMGGATVLAANRTLSGSYSDDPDRKQAQKESGQQEYALNLPSIDGKQRQMDISWIPVVGSNAVASAAAYDAYNDGEGDIVGNIATGLTKGGEAMFDQSMFQGLQRLFGTGDSYNSDQGIVANMADTVKSGLGQFIPSLARQSAQVMDPYMRDLANSNKDTSIGPMDNYDINSLANNVPYLREQYLAPKVNTQGELMLENQGRSIPSKILEDMFLPGKLTEVETGPLYDEAMRLSEANDSDKAFLPKANFKAVQDEGYTMSNDEWVDYQQKYYKAMNSGANQLIQNDYYKSLDDLEKEKMLSNVYSDIKSAINSEYTGKELKGAAKAYSEAGGGEKGNKAVINYYITKNLANGAGTSMSSKAAESIEAAVNRGDMASAQRIANKEAKYQTALDNAGIEGSEGARKAFNEGGTAGLQEYAKYKTTLEKYGLSNTEANRAMLDKYGESGLKEKQSFDGLDGEEAFKRYQYAKSNGGDVSASEYVSTVKEIDGSGDKGNVNGQISQDELIAYLNEINATQEEANKLWNTYGQFYSEKPWAKIPKLEGGAWKAKKK